MAKRNMEELFETMPELPLDFEDECRSYARPIPIFYRRKGKKAECTCGRCGYEFTREDKPERYVKTSCKVCGREGLYEWKRVVLPKTEYYTVVIIQKRTDGNLVARHFRCINTYQQGVRQQFSCTEFCRQFYDMGDYYKFNLLWTTGGMKWGTGQAGITYADVLYPGSELEIEESNFKYFRQGCLGLLDELKAFAMNPAIEMFEKMGLKELRDELVDKGGKSKYINRRGKTVKAQLRLKDKQKINYLVQKNGSMKMLHVLQMEEKKGVRLKENQRDWMIRRMYSWHGEESMRTVMRFMSIEKMINRVKAYALQDENYGKYPNPEHHTNSALGKYADYLEMREELGYDMSNPVFLFPKNLEEKHDEMVAETQALEDALIEVKKNEKYAEIKNKFEKLNLKYGYEAAGLLIRPAKYAAEILAEGRMLHHCVGRDAYMEKHNNGKTFILFLRRSEEPDKPYYTIEIKDKKIIQWYGLHDKKPDIETVGPWLNEYILHLGGTQAVYVAQEVKPA